MKKKKKNEDLEKLLEQQRKNFAARLNELMAEQNITPEELERRIASTKVDPAEVERNAKKMGLAAKYFREKKNMTMQEVADKCELSLDTIVRFENGDPELTYDTMVLICYALEISLFDLANISDVAEP